MPGKEKARLNGLRLGGAARRRCVYYVSMGRPHGFVRRYENTAFEHYGAGKDMRLSPA